MFKRQKWFNLTIPCDHEKHRVPIFRASCGGCKTTPLFKTLLSNKCQNNCKFCQLRYEREITRDSWKPEEFANVAMKLWKMRKIKGVFLSSSVEKDPNFTVEREIQAIDNLRKMGFTEYVHLKIMPGTDRELIKRAAEISDRIGINLELPNKEHYEDMKLYLNFLQDIVRRMRWISEEVNKLQKQGKCKAGLDSQMVVGASDETDKEIIKVSSWLYQKLNARRVYYSRFEPIKNTPLENKEPENPWREYRLYQASFLLRDYGFKNKDFVFNDNDKLNLKEDPKFSIAKENELIVDVNEAEFEELIKVPGIGIKTAQKIIEVRPIKDITILKSVGVITKRATPFIELNNIHQTTLSKWIN
jgi:predicted DNA-binding helix-hairpin-helix protein